MKEMKTTQTRLSCQSFKYFNYKRLLRNLGFLKLLMKEEAILLLCSLTEEPLHKGGEMHGTYREDPELSASRKPSAFREGASHMLSVQGWHSLPAA